MQTGQTAALAPPNPSPKLVANPGVLSRAQPRPQHHRNCHHGRAARDALDVGLGRGPFRVLVARFAARDSSCGFPRATVYDPA